MALQALKKEPRRNIPKEESALPTTKLPTSNFSAATTSTNSPPIPHGINAARRVVSTDTIGDSDTDSTTLEHPSKRKEEEEEAVSSLEKPLDTNTCSTPEESGTTTSARSSPLSSSQTTTNESATSTDDTSKAADFSHILADPEGWLKKTDNLFAKLPPIDRTSDKEIVVQANDVLCGRGGETNHHPGNIRYRSLVKAYQKLYLLAKRRDKPKIAQCIVVSVRGVEGRFLKRTKNANKGSTWVDVGNVKAREKTSQALREGAPNLRENVNPPVTSPSTNDSTTTTSARQVPVPEQAENITVPPPSAPALPTTNPPAFQSFAGWKWQETAKGSNPTVPPVSSSSVPHPSSSPPVPLSDAESEAYMKIFSKATAQLMQHPAFHQLDPARQREAILYECNNARAAVESAKRSSTGKSTSANTREEGRTSPMIPAAAIKQQTAPQAQQHRQPYPPQEYPYYNHGQHHHHHHYYPQMNGNFWPDANDSNPKATTTSTGTKPQHALSLLANKSLAMPDKKVDLQSVYRDLQAAKAAASSRLNLGLASAVKKEEEPASNEEQRIKTKKRTVPSSSNVHSISSNAAVVSDTGSDTSSSSSSSCESLSASTIGTAVKDEKIEAVTAVSRGGSRLKRLKLRMKDDFN